MAKNLLIVITIYVSSGVMGGSWDSENEVFGSKNDVNDVNFDYYELSTPYPLIIRNGDQFDYLRDQEIKRAPTGFLGMRGKKDFVFEDAKRAPAGFLGMRGKKDYDFEEAKRTPAGFMGMRGKKTPAGFMGMRGKKAPQGVMADREGVYLDPEYWNALLGSNGDVRQKRTFEFGGRHFLKKMFFFVPSNEATDTTRNRETETLKRAPTGFIGMRGRREISGLDAHYFEDRRKKAWMNSGIFGSRGNKEYPNLRNKFVAVRGKKTPEQSGTEMQNTNNDEKI